MGWNLTPTPSKEGADEASASSKEATEEKCVESSDNGVGPEKEMNLITPNGTDVQCLDSPTLIDALESMDVCSPQSIQSHKVELIAGEIEMEPMDVDRTLLCPDLDTSGDSDVTKVTIKVKDFMGILGTTTEAKLFYVTPDTEIGDFFIQVADRFDLELGSFDITYQTRDYSYNLGNFGGNETLAVMGIELDPDKVYCFGLDQVPTTRKRKTKTNGDRDVATESSYASDLDASLYTVEPIKKDFVGLKNKNMTCYLNSFLQGLWFTPEFRNAIYNFVHDPEKCGNRRSLAVPIQKLFLQQQFSIRDSIDTDELIRTFGWQDRETWNQHDIEELCSLFMDNLIKEFRGTPLDGLLQALYFGKLDDYVKCLECNKASQRTDDFLVVPLPIRNFGSLLSNPTLEAAMNSFVAPELLDGTNQYNCSNCNKPCDAHKGLKFKELPYIIMFQLKRFEYDFEKERRFKLNDSVVFPLLLDMNAYVDKPPSDRLESLRAAKLTPPSMGKDGTRELHSRPNIQMVDPDSPAEGDVVVDGATGTHVALTLTGREAMRALVQLNGPEIYQLYAVMVHRGGINSGHYYAYIMDFERNMWFRCDDATVRKATLADIQQCYGGAFDEEKEASSAYMLLYRRFDEELNVLPYYLSEMPLQMQQMWKDHEEEDKKLHAQEELEKNTIRMACYLRCDVTKCVLEKTILIPKTLNMEEAGVFVYKEFLPHETEIPRGSDMRLCRYDSELGVIETSFSGCEQDLVFMSLRRRPQKSKVEGLLLEVKLPDQSFEPYRHDDKIFLVRLTDCWEQEIGPPHEIHMQPNQTVTELKEKVMKRLGLSGPLEELVAVASCPLVLGNFTKLVGDHHPISLFRLERITELYVQMGPEADLSNYLIDFVQIFSKSETILIFAPVPALIEAIVADATTSGEPEKPVMNGDIVNGVDEAQKGEAEENKENKVPVSRQKQKRNHYMKLMGTCQTDEPNLIAYEFLIDTSISMQTVSARISELIKVQESEFIFYKVDKEESMEIRKYQERVSTLKPFDRLQVKIDQRLKDGEARVPLYLLRIGCAESPLQYICELVVTLNMTVDEIKKMTMKKLEGSGVPELQQEKIRIRKKLRTNPGRVMRPNTKMQDLYNAGMMQTGELYVQLLNEPCTLNEKTYSVMYRHWHGSTGVLDPAVEIYVVHDYSADLEEIILAKLRESMGLTEDIELDAAKPDGSYPWDISNRSIVNLSWFSLKPPVKKSLYVSNDELVLFVRDKNETLMDFNFESEEIDEMEAYRPRNVLRNFPVNPENSRRETGLKLDLSKSPSKP